MLVHAIGNAPSSQLVRKPQDNDAVPVMREKVFGLTVDRDILFTDDHNIYRPGIEKRQRKWIVKLAFLKDFLLPGERVLRITSATKTAARSASGPLPGVSAEKSANCWPRCRW